MSLSKLIDPELVSEVLALRQGDHLCLIYEDDPAEQMPVLLPFIHQGLANGEQCLYVADDQTIDEVRSALSEYGIDVDLEANRGALLLWTRAEWRQPGELDPASKAAQVRQIIYAALASGFRGVRLVVEMTWALGPAVDVVKLRLWEATINTIFTPDMAGRIICQYSRRHLTPEAIQTALVTHPVAVLGMEVCPNPYYEAPLILNGGSASGGLSPEAARVDWMISQLRWARAFQKEREQRVRAEAALHEAEISRQRAEELWNLVQATAEDLRRAIAFKDEFLSFVSHELRTPITVILGNTQALIRTLSDRNLAAVPEEHYNALLDIRAEGERLNRIIGNLLILARLEGGHQPETEPILIAPILERVIQEHRRRYPHRKVNVDYVAARVPCLGSEAYVEQILANLLSNAEKYSPKDCPIDVLLGKEGDWRIVLVSDRGIGITDADTGQVFEAFYRSDRASQVNPGAGIGLAVCKRLVEAQGGRIWAKPREGGGAEFGFSLRVCEAPGD